MSSFSKFYPSIFLFVVLIFFVTTNRANAAGFANPVLKSIGTECSLNNLRGERFSTEFTSDERIKLCYALNKIAFELNSNNWSPTLSAELRGIWKVFSDKSVILRPMPKNSSSRILAMAQAFPMGATGTNFDACVYMRTGKSDSDAFFQILMHELRHIYDSYETWKNKTVLNSYEMERRAYSLMGKIAQESKENNRLSGIPSFWNESWRNLPNPEIFAKREASVEKYLQDNKIYRDLEVGQQKLDFTYLNYAKRSKSEWQQQTQAITYKYDGSEKLPVQPILPSTESILPQNIQEADFKLAKPRNTRDPNEILRVALSNEKKFYQGMSNFVYDRNLQFQCWKKGKITSQFEEKSQIAHTKTGTALVQQIGSSSESSNDMPLCVSNYKDLQTDFTETFWACPALEKMPITFAGFREVNGKILAQYTVLKPSDSLYNQLASEYSGIRPFRVFVGTIYVSPEDGQIVKFWGTSYPEDNVTGNNSQKILASYSVTALRQKLNFNGGIWVTVHIGTIAVTSVDNNPRPFSYTVNFENYRQATTDIKIFDDEKIETAMSVAKAKN